MCLRHESTRPTRVEPPLYGQSEIGLIFAGHAVVSGAPRRLLMLLAEGVRTRPTAGGETCRRLGAGLGTAIRGAHRASSGRVRQGPQPHGAVSAGCG